MELTLRLNDELAERLRRAAAEHDRSMSAEVRQALRAWLARIEQAKAKAA